MNAKHTVVWVDHHEATVLHLHEDDAKFEKHAVHGPHRPTHHAADTGGHRRPLDAHFAERIAEAIRDSEELLLCGPGSAKEELAQVLRDKHAPIAARIVAVEALDHPSERQLADHARRFFQRTDRMRGVHVS